MALTNRERAFGQDHKPTPVDRFGIWLSSIQIRRHAGSLAGKTLADAGCGYAATFARTRVGIASQVFLLDVSISPELKVNPRVTAIEGLLPDTLVGIPDGAIDVVLCNSVLEHLWKPGVALSEFLRILAPGGVALLNVPSWRGKRFLELSAFRLGLSPACEMDDHKMYYDPRDLWPLLVEAGFRPRDIKCFRHKFGLNTFAVCRKPGSGAQT